VTPGGRDEDRGENRDGDHDRDDGGAADHPIEGQVIILAGAKASVPLSRLPDLLARAQADLAPRLDEYRDGYELVGETDAFVVFLVPTGHWEAVGDRLGFEPREADAVRRAHEEQLLRVGTRTDRREEFATALEIREAVVIAR
jgi:hypothetical protein